MAKRIPRGDKKYQQKIRLPKHVRNVYFPFQHQVCFKLNQSILTPLKRGLNDQPNPTQKKQVTVMREHLY